MLEPDGYKRREIISPRLHLPSTGEQAQKERLKDGYVGPWLQAQEF